MERCHTTCERYINELAEHRERQKIIYEAKRKEFISDSFHADNVDKTKRNMRRMRRDYRK